MRALLAVAVLSAVSVICVAQPAPAPEPASPITDRFALRAGGFFGSVQTQGRVDDPAASTPGTLFSLEDDFHLASSARQLRAEFQFRLRERNRLRVNMWELNRSASGSPPTDIIYGSSAFAPTDQVDARFDWRQIDFTYTYSLLRGRQFELGAGLGLHLLQAEAEASVVARRVHEDLTGAGPFVTVAVDGTWCIARRWALTARGQYLSVKVSSAKGALSDYHADVQYRWRPNLAFGLGYESTHTQLDVTDTDPTGLLRLDTRGPELFARASF